MIKNASVTVLSKALTPVVHNEVEQYEATRTPVKGKDKPQRRIPIMVESDGRIFRANVPAVSGNAVRGLGRRLLIDHTFDILGIDLKTMFKSNEDARRVAYFFRNGGLTAKDTKVLNAPVGTYESIQEKLPFLAALGGVYQGHHFAGDARIGIMIPLTRETYPVIENVISPTHKKKLTKENLPSYAELTGSIRYTRRSGEEKSEDKESMLYGTEVIPAGTFFYSYSSIVTPYESAILAFRAMFFLLSEYGYVGGMSGRGHGKMLYDILYTDDENVERTLTPDDYKEYKKYLEDNKKEITEAIKSIPEALPWEFKKESDGGKKKEDDK